MRLTLGINTGFALNRFPTPEEWIPLVSKTFGLRVVQLTADLINPSLPDDIIADQIQRIKNLCKIYEVEIKHTFTGAFTRVNHLAHPDPKIREYWLSWFYRFVDISSELGAYDMGSHLCIFSVFDNNDLQRKNERFTQVVEGWQKISQYAAKKGLKYLTWEPMSISREVGETIDEARRVHKILNVNMAIPMRLCLDVDHGDVASPDSRDTDPYAWINALGVYSPIIHIKQTFANKGGHWPFVPEYNSQGKIVPERLIHVLESCGVKDVTLLLELSFKEREPQESRVINDIKLSVDYWKPFVSL
jgi:D-erythrulose 1-phosphate 3-epimerase